VDTGIINIITATECTKEGEEYGKPWAYTRSRYYHEIKNERSVARARRWLAPLAGAYAELQRFPRLTASVDRFEAYLRVWRQPAVFGAIMAEMLKLRWRQEYFDRYGRKQSALMSYFSAMRAGRAEDETLGMPCLTLVFGDGQFRSSGRGYRAAPTRAVKQAAIAIFGRDNVFLEDEYLSSQMHAACGQLLRPVHTAEHPSRFETRKCQAHMRRHEHYEATRLHAVDPAAAAEGIVPGGGRLAPRAPRPFRQVREVRGLHQCDTLGCPDDHRRLVDRDVNASRCIRLAFLARLRGNPRPAFLCRPTAGQPRVTPGEGVFLPPYRLC
jgi:hypothetical protein